ncbi:hypothetical protein KSP40_PGU021283 [Platanthera guangdongensis]|uniref:Uncharacterized protein n=1 Tax=Platanthera guangdongensis TaxID=2320717 RepID=A0ABR2N048_9ASPA
MGSRRGWVRRNGGWYCLMRLRIAVEFGDGKFEQRVSGDWVVGGFGADGAGDGSGVEMTRGVVGEIDGGKVERVVRMVMEGDKGREMRQRAARNKMQMERDDDGERRPLDLFPRANRTSSSSKFSPVDLIPS